MPRGRKVDIRSARHQKLIKRIENTGKYMDAITHGIERGSQTYTKPRDIAVAILTELSAAGFQIIPRPHRKDK